MKTPTHQRLQVAFNGFFVDEGVAARHCIVKNGEMIADVEKLLAFIEQESKLREKELCERIQEACEQRIAGASGNGLWTTGMEDLYNGTIKPLLTPPQSSNI